MSDEDFNELLRKLEIEDEDPRLLGRFRKAIESSDDSEDLDPITAKVMLFVLRKMTL